MKRFKKKDLSYMPPGLKEALAESLAIYAREHNPETCRQPGLPGLQEQQEGGGGPAASRETHGYPTLLDYVLARLRA